MTSVLCRHPQTLSLPISENSSRSRPNKVQCLGYPNMEFILGGTFSAKGQQCMSIHGRSPRCKLVTVRAVSDDAESSNTEDEDQDKKNEKEEANLRSSREDLERIVGTDDSTFSGVDLAALIRKKYGRSYDVQLIKKEFMGRNLLAMNVMWKYMEQRSFPLTEEEYILRLDDVANTLKCWGAVSHIRNSLEKLKERPRIGKAVSIFIDMDESGGRSNEWIYK